MKLLSVLVLTIAVVACGQQTSQTKDSALGATSGITADMTADVADLFKEASGEFSDGSNAMSKGDISGSYGITIGLVEGTTAGLAFTIIPIAASSEISYRIVGNMKKMQNAKMAAEKFLINGDVIPDALALAFEDLEAQNNLVFNQLRHAYAKQNKRGVSRVEFETTLAKLVIAIAEQA